MAGVLVQRETPKGFRAWDPLSRDMTRARRGWNGQHSPGVTGLEQHVTRGGAGVGRGQVLGSSRGMTRGSLRRPWGMAWAARKAMPWGCGGGMTRCRWNAVGRNCLAGCRGSPIAVPRIPIAQCGIPEIPLIIIRPPHCTAYMLLLLWELNLGCLCIQTSRVSAYARLQAWPGHSRGERMYA